MMPYFFASSASGKSRDLRLSRSWRCLASILGEHLVQDPAHLDDPLGTDLDIRCLTFYTTERLMDHDLGIWERSASPSRHMRRDDCGHRAAIPTQTVEIRVLDVLHRVDRQPCLR